MKRRLIFLSLILILVILICALLAYPQVRQWRYEQLIEARIEQQDWQQAVIMAEKLLEHHPGHMPTLQRMIEISRLVPWMDELEWWSRLVEQYPDDVDLRLGYAECALWYGNLRRAAALLAEVPDRDREKAAYLSVAAAVSAQSGRMPEAESLIRQLIELQPESQEHTYQLFTILLKQRNRQDTAEVQRLMQQLLQDTDYALPARRAMLRSCIEYQEWKAAYELSTAVVIGSQGHMEDLLRHLQVSMRFGREAVFDALALFAPQLEEHPVRVLQLTQYLLERDRAAWAEQWLNQLNPDQQSTFYYRIAQANTLFTLGKYPAVEALTEEPAHWGKNEIFRLTIQARLYKAIGRTMEYRSTWQQALGLTQDSPATALILARGILSWDDWIQETRQLLWKVLQQGIFQQQAEALLKQQFTRQNDTAGLLELTSYMLQQYPQNKDYLNDFIMYSLLLDQNVEQAYREAATLFRQLPEQILPRSTYAFSLFHQGEVEQALTVIREMDARAFRIPSVAHYYAVILRANGLDAEAAPHLETAQRAALLPEEVALLER